MKKSDQSKLKGADLSSFDIPALERVSQKQDEGAWFDLIHPVSGGETGMRVKIAGPDSEIQRKARLAAENALMKLPRMSADARETIAVEMLAALILEWDMQEAGGTLPLTKESAIRLLRAGTWIRAQIDSYAASREPYFVDAS